MGHTSTAVVFESPGNLSVREVLLPELTTDDCLVEVLHSGISTGTERLLWTGDMPFFPGLQYPLVPGYESVGRVLECGANSALAEGQAVFIPGSRGFENVAGLFGGAAKHLVVPSHRLIPLSGDPEEASVLLALVATAIHALGRLHENTSLDLIVGNGVLGRLIARVAKATGNSDIRQWETNLERQETSVSTITNAIDDARTDYRTVVDVSGDSNIINQAVAHMGPGSTLVLAGFYHQPLTFDFAPAFMREIDIRIAAEWREQDMERAAYLLANNLLTTDDLITHRFAANDAKTAYTEAFSNPKCLKTVLDWSVL